ncbi:c1q globular head like domain containing protein [uncultured Mediterranean phage uvMED]|nr:c1q globular head like domain containing protein [uncultured Mediterranean phage uvMED]
MSYIGRKPTVGNFQICDAISVVNGQAAYTMQVGSVNVIPQSANHMIVSLNGTIQKPNSSFTVSGAVITFSSNLVTNDVIDFIQILGDVLDLGVPSDATVTAAKLNNDIISGTTALTSEPADTDEFLVSDAGTLKRIDYSLIKGGGITMADQWRITASASDVGSDVLDANWERADSYGLGQIGSAMSVSGAVFTFPSTGYYSVTFQAKMYVGNEHSRYNHVYILATTDGTNYNTAAEGSTWFSSASDTGNKYGSASTNIIFDVTNTSTHKLKFQRNTEATTVTEGDTNRNLTFATFIRLGDT